MEIVTASISRRTGNYKPNIWNYDRLLSTTSTYNEEKYNTEAETLKEEVRGVLGRLTDPLHKLEYIDWIKKLALSHYFEEEISESLHEIACMNNNITSSRMDDDLLYHSALYFRILRQHGYLVPEDVILQQLDDGEKPITSARWDDKATVEILVASHLAFEDECELDRIKDLAAKNLNSNDDPNVKFSAKGASHYSVNWFNARKYMHAENNFVLQRLAGLTFNMIQMQHQNELKEILIWWRNLNLLEVLTFTRDRAVESFLWAVGTAYEPQYGSLRKWLTKTILLILVIDDVYDIYGLNHELEQFTTAVERWDPTEVQQLPEAIKRCFWALYNTTNEIDHEIQKDKGWSSVLQLLKEEWTGFCKAMLVEAKWYHTGHSPSLVEYLDNGWISSSGPVLCLHLLFGIGQDMLETMATFNNNREIIHQASLIIRLCNDNGTSKAELERGDAPSSILCYMRQLNTTEEEARAHIGTLISDSWKKINGIFIKNTHPTMQPMIRYIVNISRVANFIYQNGDGYGIQDNETRDQVLSCLIDPLPLN